jgi:hypothetical protein
MNHDRGFGSKAERRKAKGLPSELLMHTDADRVKFEGFLILTEIQRAKGSIVKNI